MVGSGRWPEQLPAQAGSWGAQHRPAASPAHLSRFHLNRLVDPTALAHDASVRSEPASPGRQTSAASTAPPHADLGCALLSAGQTRARPPTRKWAWWPSFGAGVQGSEQWRSKPMLIPPMCGQGSHRSWGSAHPPLHSADTSPSSRGCFEDQSLYNAPGMGQRSKLWPFTVHPREGEEGPGDPCCSQGKGLLSCAPRGPESLTQ